MLYLDFEGSHAKGVRQIGYLITEDNKITKAEEKNDDDAVKCLFNLKKMNSDILLPTILLWKKTF